MEKTKKLKANYLDKNEWEGYTPQLQYFVRLTFVIVVCLYFFYTARPLLIITNNILYLLAALFATAHIFLRRQHELNKSRYRYIFPALVMDVTAAHCVWLFDPVTVSPLFLLIIVAAFGNGLQHGIASFRWICCLSIIISAIVLKLRTEMIGMDVHIIVYVFTGYSLIIYGFILINNIQKARQKIHRRNRELQRLNISLQSENDVRKKIEEKLRDKEQILNNYHDTLEDLVKRRTNALEHSNTLLKTEIGSRNVIEQKLIKSEEQYRNLYKNVSDFLVFHDFEGNWIENNICFKKEFDFGQKSSPRNMVALLTQDSSEIKLDNHIGEVKEYIEKVKENGYAKGIVRILTKDGDQRIIEYHSSLVYNSEGESIGIQGSGRDITKKWQATKELKRIQQRLENIIEFLPDATLVVDREKKVIAWNLAMEELTNIPKAVMIGKGSHEYAVPFYGKRRKLLSDLIEAPDKGLEDLYDFVKKENHTYYAEVFMPTLKHGRGAYIRTTASPLFDKNGNIEGAIQAFRDITEIKQAEKEAKTYQMQLFQADKMTSLGTLVAGVAHEINNPVSSITLNAPMLRRIADSARIKLDDFVETHGDFELSGMKYTDVKERVPVLIDNIITNSKRIKTIINELKDFTRETPPAMTDNVDINEVITKASELVLNMIKKSTDNFSMTLKKPIPTFKGNNIRVEQVIINLLINACQAIPDKSCGLNVRTDYSSQTGKITVSIKDEGIGMSHDVINRIQDPFFTTKRDDGGTGLGLSISEKIIRNHGGTMKFISSPGKGTTAALTFNPNDVSVNYPETKTPEMCAAEL